MRRLIPLLLLCSACASQYPPAGGGLVAPSAAPTASLPFDAISTRDAAQLQVDAASRATQAVIDVTEQAQRAKQWEVDYQLTQQQITRDALALSMTLEAYGAGATLTALYLEQQKLRATGTAQAVAHDVVARIDAQNNARDFAKRGNDLFAAGVFAVLLIGGYAAKAYIDRRRWAPYALPGGAQMIEARATPALPEPKWSAAELEALDFLAIGAAYIDTHPEQPASQIPSCEKLEKWGASKFVHGDDWQRARNLLGALAASSNRGTFCRDYTVKGLHQALLDKRHPIPYPNPDTPPHSEHSAHSGGILDG